MNGLTLYAPRLQTGFTTVHTAIPPRQRGFVVSAFPLSRFAPLTARPGSNRRRGLRGQTKAVLTVRISPAVVYGSCGPRRHFFVWRALAFILFLE